MFSKGMQRNLFLVNSDTIIQPFDDLKHTGTCRKLRISLFLEQFIFIFHTWKKILKKINNPNRATSTMIHL